VTGSNEITVDLGGTYATVKLYDPMVGTTPVRILTGVNSVSLDVGDHALIVEVR